jgi:predicted dinucleotide-binding enzyme
MSLATLENTLEEHETMIASDSAKADSSIRDAFTRQTGQALITLGTLFKYVPPFNESIDKSTSETLITLGKKLKGKH